MRNPKNGLVLRESEAIAGAQAKCKALSETSLLVNGSRKALVVSWICEIAQHCLEQRPLIRPTVPVLVQMGRLRFGDEFPAERTIYNQYRAWTAIWGKGYEELLTLQASKLRSATPAPSLERFQVGDRLDVGTLEHLRLIERQTRAHEAEIRCLRAFIAQNVPAPAVSGAAPEATRLSAPMPDWEPVMAWLRELDAGRLALEVDDIGLRATRKAGPNPRIMPAAVLAILRSASEGRK